MSSKEDCSAGKFDQSEFDMATCNRLNESLG